MNTGPTIDALRTSAHPVFPIAMSRIADGIIVSMSVMWTYITVAEYVNAKVGLGQFIQNARRFSAMDQVFVGIFVIIALALVTYAVMTAIDGLVRLHARIVPSALGVASFEKGGAGGPCMFDGRPH